MKGTKAETPGGPATDHSGEVVLERTFNDIVEYQDFLGRTFDAPGQLPVGTAQVDPNADTDDY